MARHRTRNPRLQDRDYEILNLVHRYRLATPDVLHRLFFDDSDRNAVTKITSKLCAHDFLRSHTLHSSYSYFTLGRRGTKVCSVSTNKLGPLGPQAKYREYGTLMFCCGAGVQRERLRIPEVIEKYPQILAGRIDSSHYYLDLDGSTVRLGYIWVEGAGSIDHIVHNVKQEIIEKRRSIEAFRKVIDEGRFVVAIVTITDDKQRQITDALNKIATTVFFRVEVVPDLVHLLPGAGYV